MVPNAPELRLPFGAVKFARSNRLNASIRTSTLARSPSETILLAARSTCQNFGPRTLLRGALPNGWLGSVGMTTQSLLNQFVIDCWPAGAYGTPGRFGRSLLLPPKSRASPGTR